MTIDTTGQKDWVQSLTGWTSRPSMGISSGASLSWTGNLGQAVVIDLEERGGKINSSDYGAIHSDAAKDNYVVRESIAA